MLYCFDKPVFPEPDFILPFQSLLQLFQADPFCFGRFPYVNEILRILKYIPLIHQDLLCLLKRNGYLPIPAQFGGFPSNCRIPVQRG